MGPISNLIAWLNEKPGRKRGVGAALLGVAAALRYLGHTDAAQGAEAVNGFVQSVLVPGGDVVGGLVTIWGLVHAGVRKS